jgi:hypothetical protein
LIARATKTHVVLDFHSNSEDGDNDFEGGEGWLASLIPLRADLLAGDLRCLYLGWLAGVENGEVEDSTLEPPVPSGLRRLSAPLRRFRDFIRLDPNLVEAAAMLSEDRMPEDLSTEALASWVAGLPRTESDQVLVRLMQSEGISLASELLLRFRKDQTRGQVRTSREGPRRTAGDLIEAANRLTEVMERKAAERDAKEQARRARDQAAARARHLDGLADREEDLWRQLEAAIQTRLPKEYDRATELLKDLRDLGDRSGAGNEVDRRIRGLREQHRSKRTLIQRMDRAGLPR